MRVLCISPFFPPTRDSESFCGGKMVLALREQGAELTVLSMTAPYLAGKQDSSALWQSLRPYSLPIGPGIGRQHTRAALCAVRYRLTIWPRWLDTVVRTARQLHDAAPYHVVYSRSLPMFAHVAGYWTARRLGLPWVANINDPWDEHLFPGVGESSSSRFYKRLSNYWLRKTLACADAVTFPSTRLAKFTAGLAGTEHRSEILPHVGWRAAAGNIDATGFRLVHAGKLGSTEITGRSTGALLGGLRKFLDQEPRAQTDTCLVLVGPEDTRNRGLIDELRLGANVISVGQVSYDESLRYIASASTCVLVEANMTEGIYLPSKLADYIAANKPVLALSPRVGTVADLASERGIMRVDDNANDIARALRELYKAQLNDAIDQFAPSQHLVKRFSPERIAKSFLSLIMGLGQPGHLQAQRPAERVVQQREAVIVTQGPSSPGWKS